MASWLVPISLFWVLAALYLGGAEINIEGGGGVRQSTGLLLNFVGFLLVWAVTRALLMGVAGAVLSVFFAVIMAAILLPLLAKLSFRAVGVRITSAEGSS